MKVRCSKSNTEFTSAGFNNYYITSEHPLLSASYSTLTEVAKDWYTGKLSVEESRVLFVALLNSTNLVDWRCAAVPSEITVQKHMEHLINTSNWKNAIGARLPLARIAINHGTCECEKVGVWLSNWDSTQREFTISSHLQSVRETIAASQSKLYYMLQTHQTARGKNIAETDTYLKHLCNWFMIATDVPNRIAVTEDGKTLKQYWTELFLLKRPAVWNAILSDLEELRDHAEEHLRMSGSIYAIAAHRHIDSIYKDCKEGVLGALTGSATYTIIQDETETAASNKATAISLAPAELPIENNYNSKSDYLLAYARWRLKQRQLAATIQQFSQVATEAVVGDSNDKV